MQQQADDHLKPLFQQSGIPDPPSLKASLVARKQKERAFLEQLISGGKTDEFRITVPSKAELREFRGFIDRAARSPRRDAAKVAAEFRHKIQQQRWHENLEGVRPRVLQTETGVRIRLTRTIPGLRQGAPR